MMNKKAFELAIGTIVILIISVVIFSMSLYFVFKWFGQAEQLKAEIDKQTREQIIAALKTGNQLVAIPISIQEAKRGRAVTFGVGVLNIGKEGPFSMAATFSGAYTPDGKEICRPVETCASYITQKWLGTFATTETFLKKNEQKLLPVLIKADTNIEQGKATPKGDYVFNMCVYANPLRKDGTPPAPCTPGQFKTDPSQFYTGKIYQVAVKVV